MKIVQWKQGKKIAARTLWVTAGAIVLLQASGDVDGELKPMHQDYVQTEK